MFLQAWRMRRGRMARAISVTSVPTMITPSTTKKKPATASGALKAKRTNETANEARAIAFARMTVRPGRRIASRGLLNRVPRFESWRGR